MQTKGLGPLLFLLLALSLVPLGRADSARNSDANKMPGPRPAEQGLGPDGALRPGPGDHCPVCGMYPARLPRYAAALVLGDGRTFYFCSNRCLLQCWRSSRKHLGVPREAIAQMYVLDYFSGAVLDAHRAWWVAGSDVIGPMGPALAALTSRADADAFIKRHGGRLVFQLHQVDDALWKKILTTL